MLRVESSCTIPWLKIIIIGTVDPLSCERAPKSYVLVCSVQIVLKRVRAVATNIQFPCFFCINIVGSVCAGICHPIEVPARKVEKLAMRIMKKKQQML